MVDDIHVVVLRQQLAPLFRGGVEDGVGHAGKVDEQVLRPCQFKGAERSDDQSLFNPADTPQVVVGPQCRHGLTDPHGGVAVSAGVQG